MLAAALFEVFKQGRRRHDRGRRRRAARTRFVARVMPLEGRALLATVTVTPQNLDGWVQVHTNITSGNPSTGSQAFVDGPATPPLGVGSLAFTIGTDGNSLEEIRRTDLSGVGLGQITTLTYSTYVSHFGSGFQAPYLVLSVNNNGGTTIDDQLVFEPVYQTGTYIGVPVPNQGTVTLNTWQTWDAKIGGWWTASSGTGGPPLVTLASYLAAHPNAKIVNAASGLGGFLLLTGGGGAAWANFAGNADALTIGVNGANTTFDFEPRLAVPLTLNLLTHSNTGEPNSNLVTNVSTPTFGGTAPAGDVVTLTATPTTGGTPVTIGQATAGPDNTYMITSAALANGTYTITATAVRPGSTPLTATLSPVIVDTVAPRITAIQLVPKLGEILITFQDNLSGMAQRGLLSTANYNVVRPFHPRDIETVTSVFTTPPTSPTVPQTVAVVLNNGRRITHARFVLTVLAAGITDVAGNELDGEFNGTFPTGNGQPGGDTVARLDFAAPHVFPPRPVPLTHVTRRQVVVARPHAAHRG
jgi:hypothetical protein